MYRHVSYLESLPEESLFFIISPKDIVLAKVCMCFIRFMRFTVLINFRRLYLDIICCYLTCA